MSEIDTSKMSKGKADALEAELLHVIKEKKEQKVLVVVCLQVKQITI